MSDPYNDPAWDGLLAENERLRTEARNANRHFGAAFNTMQARIAALEAERDRLREALRQIIDGATEYTRSECAIARAALEGSEE